jgi:hypothetical protein
MSPKSLIAVITYIKEEKFYDLVTKLGELKSLYIRNQFTLCKDNFYKHLSSQKGRNKCTWSGKKASFSWWTRIQKMQLFKEVYHEDVFVQINQFTL